MANQYLSINMGATGGTDAKDVKVSIDDTTPAFLEAKVLAGSTKVTVATLIPGGNETLAIDVVDSQIDHNALLNYDINDHRKINDSGTLTTELFSANKIIADLALKIDLAEKAANNGVATLDAGGKVPSSQLPNSVMQYLGSYDVTTNTPTLADGIGNAGDVYIVTVAGTIDLGSGPISFLLGDWAMYNGTIWEKSTNSDAVTSVNTQLGDVVLVTDNISDTTSTSKYTSAADISKLAGIEANATADQTDAEIKIAYENNADTNAFTDAEKTNLGNQSGTNTGDEVASTTTVSGIAELATTTEVNTGTDNTRIITPLALASSQLQIDVTANNAKVSADGLVTTHSDVTDAGSGIIISAVERSKLAAIEPLADVTDTANVAAAGATMNTDTALTSNAYFLDEDDMLSNDATKVASQQSIKTYVDTEVAAGGNVSAGDVQEGSFSGVLDTDTGVDVIGLSFATATVRSFKAQLSVVVTATADLYEEFIIHGVQKAGIWDYTVESIGDDSQISFDITAAGQVQYTKLTTAGWVSTLIKYRADTTTV